MFNIRLLALAFISIIVVVVIVSYFNGLDNKPKDQMISPQSNKKVMRYIPIGDSYTIGEGVAEADRWPNMLVKHLQEQGVTLQIVTNPSISGFTVSNALDQEIKVFEQEKPDFATVLLGANDVYQRIPEESFKKSYQDLLDRMQKSMDQPKQIVLINIPDFGKSPAGQYQGRGVPVTELIKNYNAIIAQEASTRDLKVVDLFSLTQDMDTPDYYVSDGLHPNDKGYAKWEEVIFPVVQEVLN